MPDAPVVCGMLSTAVRFVLDVEPATKKTSQQVVYSKKRNRPFVLPSETNKKFVRRAVPQLEAVAQQMGLIKGALLGQPVLVSAQFYRRGSFSGDLINYQQALADVMEGTLLANDRWIMGWDGSRLAVDRHAPRIEVLMVPAGLVPPWHYPGPSEWLDGNVGG